MKIYNNIDCQARLVENIADGVNTDDAASVGQVNASSYSPVRYSASRDTQLYVASADSTGDVYLTRAQLIESEYTSGCTSNTSGTNLVNLSTGVYFINFDCTFYLNSSNQAYYPDLLAFQVFCRIQSSVGFADGVGQLFSRNGIQKKTPSVVGEYVYQIPMYMGNNTQRIVNVASTAVISFSMGASWTKRTASNLDVYLYSSSVSIFKI
jgi:hypothetical protein